MTTATTVDDSLPADGPCEHAAFHGNPIDPCHRCNWTSGGVDVSDAPIPSKQVTVGGKPFTHVQVKVTDIEAYQERMEGRVRRQRDSIDRLLNMIHDHEKTLRANAAEIARLTGALVEEQQMYADQKVLLDRARDEREKALHVLFEIMTYTQDPELTREGESFNVGRTSTVTKAELVAEPHVPLDPETEAVITSMESTLENFGGLPVVPGVHMPVGEERPTPEL